jgi:glyoxylase I family protein
MSILRVGHIGVCVSDMERALAFYCDLLGFRPLTQVQVNDALSAKLLRLPGVDQRTAFVERDGVRLALFALRTPPVHNAGRIRDMNEAGMVALMLRVDDLDATLATMRKAGVRVLDETRVDHPAYGSKLVFVTDPDGMLVELIEVPGDPYTPFGKQLLRP